MSYVMNLRECAVRHNPRRGGSSVSQEGAPGDRAVEVLVGRESAQSWRPWWGASLLSRDVLVGAESAQSWGTWTSMVSSGFVCGRSSAGNESTI